MTTVALALGGLAGAAGLMFLAFTVSFRTKFPPVQNAIRRFNRDVTNPRQLRRAGQPGAWASVVHHTGRASGTAYETPVVVVDTDDGYVIALPYGPHTDWVRNVLASGSATLHHEGRSIQVNQPTLAPAARVNPHFNRKEQRMHKFYSVDDFLHVREATPERQH